MKIKLTRSVTLPWGFYSITIPKDTILEATQLGPHYYQVQYGYLYRGDANPVPEPGPE